jgi:hypothetical protein
MALLLAYYVLEELGGKFLNILWSALSRFSMSLSDVSKERVAGAALPEEVAGLGVEQDDD